MEALGLDSGLIDEHDRNVLAYRVYPFALDALQSAPVLFENQIRFANGANQDIEQLFAHRHGKYKFINENRIVTKSQKLIEPVGIRDL
jgi:hypothetical protein